VADFDKDALRRSGGKIQFNLVRPGDPAAWMDSSVSIEPRTGDAWRACICDTDQLGEQICHVETIRSATTNALELLRVALNAYRTHRGPVDA
jgi:hypothetical protein